MSSSPINRFCRLPTPSYEKIYADANRILDDIISQCHTYRKPNQSFDPKEMVAFISHGCEILQNATILLRSKFAQVVNINLPLIKNCIDEKCLNSLVLFLCQSLSNIKSSLVSEFIKALALTLAGNGPYLNEDCLTQLLEEDGIIWLYLNQEDWIVKGYALQCLGSMCLKSQNSDVIDKQYLQLCYSKLLNMLHVLLSNDAGDINQLKLVNIALKALQNVLSSISMNDGIVEPEFAVALLKLFLLYGTQDYRAIVDKLMKVLPSRKTEDIEKSEKIYPTKRKEKSAMTKKIHAKKNRRKKKKNLGANIDEGFDNTSEEHFSNSYGFNANWRQSGQSASSSESEYSDSESAQLDQMNSVFCKIRQNAATTIQEILHCCDRRSKFSCWLILLPDSISESEPSLLSSLAMEHSAKIRTAVLLAMMEVIDGSKGFLDSAVNVGPRVPPTTLSGRPYTPFSMRLNQSLHTLHETLLTTLQRETLDLAKDKVVKCITLLMLNAPYRKIGVDYLPDIVAAVSGLLHSNEITLCQSVLTCLAACMSVQPDNLKVLQLLQRSSLPTNTILANSQSSTGDASKEPSWLVLHCIQHLTCATQDSARELRLSSEYIQLLTVVLRCHPSLIDKNQREKIVNMCINVFMFSTDQSISVHAIKMLEEFAKFYQGSFHSTKDDIEGTSFWRKMLGGAIPQYLHVEPKKSVKGQAAICDWMSNIGSHFFSVMKSPEQIFIKTILVGLSSSEETILVAAAVRALGVIIDYECMKDDVWFVVDVTRSILNQLENLSVNIRLKAAWSLANLCDFIAKNGFLEKEYPESLILNLFDYSTKASLDNEKVSSNGVRALGNLLKSFPAKLFEKENFQEKIEKAVKALIQAIQTGSMKTRWNACYACRYMFENSDCPVGKAEWTEDLYSCLLEALSDCKNFKVRISAAAALCSPIKRSCYGDDKLFARLWRETLIALDKSEELADFTEFKHKETLQDQSIILLLHLLAVATLEDLSNFRQDVQKYHKVFLTHCKKCVAKVEVLASSPSEFDNNSTKVEEGANPVVNEITEDEKVKRNEISQHIGVMKNNLCAIIDIDKNTLTMDIIRTALHLNT